MIRHGSGTRNTNGKFFRERLLYMWWSQLRETFTTDMDWTYIWNVKEIRIDKTPVHYKNYFES